MFLEDILIEKKDHTLEPYDSAKLLAAVNKSAVRARGNIEDDDDCIGRLTEDEEGKFLAIIEKKLIMRSNNVIRTSYMHTLVENALKVVAPDVAEAYITYHSFRLHQAEVWNNIYGKCSAITSTAEDEETLTLKRQNANADATLSSTKRCFFADYTGEEFFHEFFLTKVEKQAIKDGYIYCHDASARMLYAVNCCLFRADYVLEHGCAINGITYTKPHGITKAFQILGDMILINASQQYGGFTVPRIDRILAPYAEMSYEKSLQKYISMGVANEIAEQTAFGDTKKLIYDGFTGLEMKLNTVASSRGDYPFTTISFGLETSVWGKVISIAALDVRRKGQGEDGKRRPVLFPKLVFLYDEKLHGKGCINEDVYEAGIRCSAACMYPDWLSLTGDGYVPSMYKKYGSEAVVSPMGCRAFLSPWYENGGMEPADEKDVPIYEGRFNIGAISLNLPMILAKAQKEDMDFYEVLNRYLEMIRKIHCRTYDYIAKMPASVNPVGFCYGGFYGGNLKPTQRIGESVALKAATASFGITALNELQQQFNHKSLVDDGEFALEVMKHINEKINEFKKEDGHLYAVYGTPAENLCGKQIKQYRALYGVVEGVSDRSYNSNSFHCHVTEKISPIQKQDLENRFWNYFNGGKIQYCRYNLGYNTNAIKTLVNRAMKMGFYEGINLSLDYCDDCGYQQVEMGLKCPKCGSYHITQIDRMNGYMGITRVGSDTDVHVDENGKEIVTIRSRFSPHKNAEIKERVSM